MPAANHPTSRAELAARWRADAQVFRRYGSPGRARMLERLAAELEQATETEGGSEVDLATAAERTGFTRGHLRRLYRDGRLVAVRMEGKEPVFRAADLPRKLPATGQVESVVRAVVREGRVSPMFPRD